MDGGDRNENIDGQEGQSFLPKRKTQAGAQGLNDTLYGGFTMAPTSRFSQLISAL